MLGGGKDFAGIALSRSTRKVMKPSANLALLGEIEFEQSICIPVEWRGLPH